MNYRIWLLAISCFFVCQTSNGMDAQMIKSARLIRACEAENPPIFALLLKAYAALGLSANLYTTISQGNFFRGNVIERNDFYQLFSCCVATAYSLLRAQHFRRHCLTALYTKNVLTADQDMQIRRMAEGVVLLDILLSLGIMVQFSNIAWHYAKVVKFRNAVAQETECPICRGPFVNAVSVCDHSQHVFCRNCIETTFRYNNKRCPLCIKSAERAFPRNLTELVHKLKTLHKSDMFRAPAAIALVVVFFVMHYIAEEQMFRLLNS